MLYFVENNAKPRSSQEDNSRGRRLGRSGRKIKGEGNKRMVHKRGLFQHKVRRSHPVHRGPRLPVKTSHGSELRPLVGWALKEKQDTCDPGELWVTLTFSSHWPAVLKFPFYRMVLSEPRMQKVWVGLRKA